MGVARKSFLALFLFGLSAADARPPITKEDVQKFWAGSGLTWSDVEMQLSRKRCSHNTNSFLGCVRGFNQALSFAKKPLALSLDGAELESVSATIDGIKIGVVKKIEVKTFGEALALMRQEKKKFAEQWSHYPKSKFPLTALHDWIRENVLSEENEGWAAASAINAWLEGRYDSHTRITTIAQTIAERDEDVSVVGIGVQIAESAAGPVVIRILEGGPAHKGGMRAQDVIESVDGVPTKGKSLDEVTTWIRGKAGTKVEIGVKRDKQTLAFPLMRQKVDAPNLVAKIVSFNGKKQAYFRLSDFSRDSACEGLENVVSRTSKSVDGIILDLRGNPGGRLDYAVCVAGIFLPKGKPIVEQRDFDGKTTPFPNPKHPLTDLPMVTLVNSGSASASEIVAGALQDHERSLVLGVRTFGKGTVQVMSGRQGSLDLAFDNDKLLYVETIARFFLPSGRTTQIDGVSPDIEVWGVPDPKPEEKAPYREEDEANVFTGLDNPPRTASHPDLPSVNQCMNEQGYAAARRNFEKHKDDAIPGDYQLFAGISALGCQIEKSEKGLVAGNP